MSETPTESTTYVLVVDAVQRAITTLEKMSIHETLPVYLHVRKQGAVAGRYSGLEPHWQGEVHEWLDLPGGPAGKPHFRPFTSRGSSLNSFWVIDNLAGMYAPSSIRTMRHLYVGPNDEYQVPTHPDGTPNPAPIFSSIFRSEKLPAWAVNAFLYRNRAFAAPTDTEAPTWDDLLAVFQYQFKWTQEERDMLFTWDAPAIACFEEFDLHA